MVTEVDTRAFGGRIITFTYCTQRNWIVIKPPSRRKLSGSVLYP